jgi:putative transposase
MGALGLRGAVAGDHKKPLTTIPGVDHRPEDALNRDFTAPAPDTRWVADITLKRAGNHAAVRLTAARG